jgi:hypothetical protein
MRLGRSARKRASDVFGVSNTVLPDSYVDRGDLDEELQRLLTRPTHIALRGASKCGKSWLRQQVLPDAVVVQCRLGKTALDIYRDALAQLGVRLEVESHGGSSWKGRAEATTSLGNSLFAKLGLTASIEQGGDDSTTSRPVGRDVTDLRFIAELIKASERRLVIEDFHYLSVQERKAFAFDLKALWDYGVFVVIVGVWSRQNMLLYLNPDLSARVQEVPIVWRETDLKAIFEQGGRALNVVFSELIQQRAIADCFENAGILQTIILGTLDETGVTERRDEEILLSDLDAIETASMKYAEQLNALYQVFAERVSTGMRKRKDSTGIYAHAMAVILGSPDEALLRGVPLDDIFKQAHARENRIQKGNLRTVLNHFEELQVDDDGRGLVLAYNDTNRELTVVDRQLLIYRKYSTVKWPWEDMIAEGADALAGVDE